MWCDNIFDGVIGPFFFHEEISLDTFTLICRRTLLIESLNEKFPNRRTGSGGPKITGRNSL